MRTFGIGIGLKSKLSRIPKWFHAAIPQVSKCSLIELADLFNPASAGLSVILKSAFDDASNTLLFVAGKFQGFGGFVGG